MLWLGCIFLFCLGTPQHVSSLKLSAVAGVGSAIAGLILSVADMSATPYDQYSPSYDKLNGGSATKYLGIDEMRQRAGEYTQGDVLELAVGTGLQTAYYDWNRVRSFTGIDNSQGMLDEARQRLNGLLAGKSGVSSKLLQSDVGKIDLADSQFDTVIDTFSICVFDRPAEAVAEMRRLVRPITGRVLLLENSRSTNVVLGFVQDATESLITPLSKGCRWNVDVPRLAQEAGLTPVEGEGGSIQLGTISLGVYSKK
mmetsp:Transcript_37052/g.82323  ORF Transcript_37052/g.82323 Transcript_37052/m.82323 type:complete len:255 (+) Transcript_37052:22-786(+)